MSNKFPNLPTIALGTYISFLPQTNPAASMQWTAPQDYLQPRHAERCNYPHSEEVCLVLVDNGMTAKANTEVGTGAKLTAEFNEGAERWEKETAIHSSPGATFLHKNYIAIISKGVANKKIIVPLILKRLQTSGADWFFALENIAGENPAKNAENFDDAFNAWCGWAKAQGLIKETHEVLAA